jgi:sodium pump decarboxylase gamma subunit
MGRTMVIEGLKLLLLGMGTVYLFLIILMYSVQGVGVFLQNKFPVKSTLTQPTYSPNNDNTLVAVISAAITAFKSGRKE